MFAKNKKPYVCKRFRIMVSFIKGSDVLDVGFAASPNPLLKDATGLDLETFPKPDNYKAVFVGDAQAMPFPDRTFDTVVAGETFEHIENQSQFLREVKRVLKSGGRFIFSTPNPYFFPLFFLNAFMIKKYYLCPYHTAELTPRNIYILLKVNGLKLTKHVGNGIMLRQSWIDKFGFLPRRIPLPTCISQNIVYVADLE